MSRILMIMPISIILIISVFLLIFLLQNKNPAKPPSALINESLPEFSVVNLFNSDQLLKNTDLKKKIILINFFASWCIPCKAEHPLFFKIKNKYPNVYLLGINHKDKKEDALKYLNNDGNPYDYVGIDKDGLIGLEFGVFGLPETFIANVNGKIIYKYLGPLTQEIIDDEIISFFK